MIIATKPTKEHETLFVKVQPDTKAQKILRSTNRRIRRDGVYPRQRRFLRKKPGWNKPRPYNSNDNRLLYLKLYGFDICNLWLNALESDNTSRMKLHHNGTVS